MLMRSNWCDISGLGIAVPAGKDQDMGPGQFYDLSVLLCPGRKFAGYHSSYHAFFMQNLQKARRVGLF